MLNPVTIKGKLSLRPLSGPGVRCQHNPVLEEVAFQGAFHDWLARRLPWYAAAAVVSITFGLIHGFEIALPIMFVGVLLSWLRWRYQSLWPCILLHCLNNSLLILALYFYPSLFGLEGEG